MHVLTGLPRSGSTLLANILAQNPKFHVTGTSPLPQIMASVSATMTNNPEIISNMSSDPDAMSNYQNAMRAFVSEFYGQGKKVLIDKSRLWASHSVLLRSLYPDAGIIVTVRDPRDIIASIERQHRKTGVFNQAHGHLNLYDAASHMMSPEGIVGSCFAGISDLEVRQVPNTVFVRYESLVAYPEAIMEKVYQAFNMKYFDHDFKDVKNVAPDADQLYMNKYPHDGSGEVTPDRGGSWSDILSDDLADLIANVNVPFMNRFGYS